MGTRRVVVIGSGFGGLASAIRLRARGFEVTILEKRDKPGGRAYLYEQDGFKFDGGPTVVTAPFLFGELFQLCGRDIADYLQFVPLDPYYRIRFHDGRIFNYSGDHDKMVEEVRKFNPGDIDGYVSFVKSTEKIYEVGFEELGDVPFSNAMDMIRIIPRMIALGSHRTVYGMVKNYIKDDALRTALSFHPLLVGGNPFTTTSIYALIHYLERKWGVWYSMGGTTAIVSALVRLFEEIGGELRLNAEVDEILVERGKVCGVNLKSGGEGGVEKLDADIVVSNADSTFTYRYLLDPSVRRKYTDKKIDSMKYSMSLFVAYFGTKVTYPDLAHHMILLGPRYRGLLDDIFDRKTLADDFSLYLHAPTRTDPGTAPDGCESFYVLSPVPHLASGIDWHREEEVYREKVYRYLEEVCLPGLSENMITSLTITPEHFKSELNSIHGSAFSVEPVLTQSAYFRPHNKSEDVEGLYFVGAGTHPGAGMPGVLSTAKVVDRLISDQGVAGNPLDPIAGSHAR
ncbi:MAG: phytoene desaturase [Cyanobacteriota/Melainabacteria group bacterium]